MSYATEQDMIDRFGEPELIQLTDIGPVATGAIDTSVLGRALEDADAEINGYLEARYPLPLASTPRLVVGVASDIARYRLYRDVVPEIVERRYADARKILENVSRGVVSLGLDAADAAAKVQDNLVEFGTSTRVFARENDRILGGDE